MRPALCAALTIALVPRSALPAEEGFFREAEALGIVEAVKASGLPERTQRRIATAIVREARANELDPLLIVAVIRIESAFDSFAVSRVGALGLMQVMPQTGHYWAARRGGRLGRATNLFDAELNIELGASYLKHLMVEFGTLEAALVAYNAGPGKAKRILSDRRSRKKYLAGYPKRVVADYHRLRAAAPAPAEGAPSR